jgi:hypothetical protein
MKFRTLILLLIVATLTSMAATVSPRAALLSVQTSATATTIPMLSGTTQPIGVAAGNQTNPSVACNLASYTSDDLAGTSSIHYFDFATNTDHVVPGNGLDRLSETDGRQNVFTQLGGSGDQIGVYDIASQTTTFIGGNGNSDPALGGNLIAFRHGEGSNVIGEIFVNERTSGVVVPLSYNDVPDWSPAVSPDGHVVVWTTCQVDHAGCSIYTSVLNPEGTLFRSHLVSGTGENASPDTNGQLIVYTSQRNGENDIYWQTVAGSTEMHLALPGDQRDVRISGNLLVFESQTADTSYDVFVYDLSTARLYQATNTPGVSETLSDIAAGCSGVNRLVYSVPGTFGDFEVYAFTFQLSESPRDQVNDLIAVIGSFNLHDGTENSLISKLQDALAAINSSDTATACASLTAFINASQAQSGKKLTAAQVKQLVDAATEVKADLGCQ